MPDDPKPAGWTPMLLLICIGTTIGTVVPVGYTLGVMNSPAEVIKDWIVISIDKLYSVKLSAASADVLYACIISIFQFGGILGSFISASITNKYGRKRALIISGCILTVAGIILLCARFAGFVWMLLFGIFLIGISTAIIYTAQPTYLLESAPTHLRGSAGVFTLLGITSGIVVGQIFSLPEVFGNKSHWQLAMSGYLLCVFIGFAPVFWFPESPSWIMKMRKDEELAKKALKSLRGENAPEVEINAEIAEIKAAAASSSEILGILDVLQNYEFCLPMFIVVSFMACQSLSGINGLFFYSISIFTKCGFSTETATWMNLGMGILNFICGLISFVLMQKLNRRPCMMISSVGCAISLCGLAFALKFMDAVSWFPMLSMMLMASYIICFNVGLGPIPLFIGTELFELPPRTAAMSAGNFSCWTGNLLICMCFPVLDDAVGPLVFLPCSFVCVYCFLLTWRYVPETRNIEPSVVKPLMANGLKSKVT